MFQDLAYGGYRLYFYTPNTTTSDTVWTYNVSTQSWKELPVANATDNPKVGQLGAWASNPATGLSYYIGDPTVDGKGNRVDAGKSAQLQEFDSSTTQFKWSTGSESAGTPSLNAAQMVYVRSGEAGVLIAFGGTDVGKPPVPQKHAC